MALNYTPIPITLKGINEKTDDKQQVVGELRELQNMWMEKTGKLQSRYGLSELADSLADNFNKTNQFASVSNWRDDVVQWGPKSFRHIRYEPVSAIYDAGPTVTEDWESGKYDFYELHGDNGVSNVIDYAEGPDYGVGARLITQQTGKYSAKTTANYIELTFYDLESKKPFYKKVYQALNPFNKVKICSNDDGVQVWLASATDVQLTTFVGYSLVDGTPEDTNYSPFTGGTVGLMDAISIDGYSCLIVNNGTNLVLYAFDTSTTTLTNVTVASSITATNLHINPTQTTDRVAVLYGTTSVIFRQVDLPTTLVGSPVTVYSGLIPLRPSFVEVDSNNMYAFIFEDNAPTPLIGPVIFIYKSTNSGASWSLWYDIPYTVPASRAFYFNGNAYLYHAKYEESDDVTNIGIVLTRVDEDYSTTKPFIGMEFLLPSKGTYNPNTDIVANVQLTSTGWITSLITKVLDTFQSRIVQRTWLSEPLFASWNSSQINSVTPNLRLFDGVNNNFIGFPVYPSQVTAVAVSGGGTNYPAADYGIRACYVRYDKNGNVSRSAPSLNYTYTNASQQTYMDISIPPYPFADEDRDYGNLFLEVYCTEGDGELYYLDGKIAINDSDATVTRYDTITYRRQTDDADITLKPALYTDAGALEHIGPEACKSFCLARERIFGVTSDNGQCWFSKARLSREMPNFSDAFVLDYEGLDGLTVPSVMDDKTILFGPDNIYTVYGVGPDETGAGNFEVQETSNELGTSQIRSVHFSAPGIYFHSERGIYLLDRGLNTVFIGDKVEDIKSETCVGVIALSDRDHSMFAYANGDILLYDEYHQIWSRFNTNLSFAWTSVCLSNSRPTFGMAYSLSYRVFQEDLTSYTDENHSNFTRKMILGWLSLAGNQVQARVRKISILGDASATGANSVTMKLYNDFIDTVVQTTTATTTTITTDNSRYQLEVKPNRQRLEALKIEFYFATTDYGYTISKMVLEAANVGGIYRQPTTKRAT